MMHTQYSTAPKSQQTPAAGEGHRYINMPFVTVTVTPVPADTAAPAPGPLP